MAEVEIEESTSSVMLFMVKTPADFTAVERRVAAMLSSDDSRCSFLRSEPFARIRVHAVYRPDDPVPPPPCWGPEGICVEIKNRLVSVEIREAQRPTYDSSWAGPVVYDEMPGFEGSFDVLTKSQGPFVPGKRKASASLDGADELV
jgi:hypothetical protein